MATISNSGIINMLRGDSFTFFQGINLGTKAFPQYYKLQEGDSLYFGVMEPNKAFEDAIIRKSYNHLSNQDDKGFIQIDINPEDTEFLRTGKYYYMVKLKQKVSATKYNVTTIVNPTLFWIEGNNPSIKNPDDRIITPSKPDKDIIHISEQGSYIIGDPSIDNLQALPKHGLISGTDSQIGIRGLKILSTSMDTATQVVTITTEAVKGSAGEDLYAEDLYTKELGYVQGSTRAALVLDHHSFDFYKVKSISGSIIEVEPIIEGAKNFSSYVNLHRDNETRNYLFLYNYAETIEQDGETIPLYASERYDFSVNDNCPARPEVDIIYSFGQDNKTIGRGTITAGLGNLNSGWYGAALGGYNTVAAYAAFAAGRYNKAVGEYSAAFNQNTKAAGTASHASGYLTEANAPYASAHNWMTKANVQASSAFGKGTRTNREAQLAAGTYNADDSTALLVIGNGSSDTDRRNAFVVKDNGSAILQVQGATDNSVVIKSTLTNELTEVNGLIDTANQNITNVSNQVNAETNNLKKEISNIIYGTENYFFTASKPANTSTCIITDKSVECLTAKGAPNPTIIVPALNDFTISFDLTTYGVDGAGWMGARPYLLKHKSSNALIQMFDLADQIYLAGVADSIVFNRTRAFNQIEHITLRCTYNNDTDKTQLTMTLENKATNFNDTKTATLNGQYIPYLQFKFEFANALLNNIMLVDGDINESKFNADRKYVDDAIATIKALFESFVNMTETAQADKSVSDTEIVNESK